MSENMLKMKQYMLHGKTVAYYEDVESLEELQKRIEAEASAVAKGKLPAGISEEDAKTYLEDLEKARKNAKTSQAILYLTGVAPRHGLVIIGRDLLRDRQVATMVFRFYDDVDPREWVPMLSGAIHNLDRAAGGLAKSIMSVALKVLASRFGANPEEIREAFENVNVLNPEEEPVDEGLEMGTPTVPGPKDVN